MRDKMVVNADMIPYSEHERDEVIEKSTQKLFRPKTGLTEEGRKSRKNEKMELSSLNIKQYRS
jgi:hypothetical protein